jgi:hypothetical protein
MFEQPVEVNRVASLTPRRQRGSVPEGVRDHFEGLKTLMEGRLCEQAFLNGAGGHRWPGGLLDGAAARRTDVAPLAEVFAG